jgi:septal ring factor EnvC (AmiA/AmiB activator)
MNSTPTPKSIESHNAPIARADEQLAHAHEQIARAGEDLARLSEQLAKMERDATRPASTGSGSQSPPGKSALRALAGLPLAACIVVAALVLQSSYGGGAKVDVARRAQLASTPSLPPEDAPVPAQPAPAVVQVAAAEAAPPQATPLAQAAPQDAAPTATAAVADQTQLLQTMARDLANLEQNIEQLRANQQQISSDNSKAIEELKASQEEIKRVLARVSEQNLPSRTSPRPTQLTPTLRKPERVLQSPHARARPRVPREWIYDDEW